MSHQLEGPIEVGDHLIWEPDKPLAYEPEVIVTKVIGDWIETSGVLGTWWNEEERVREACVRAEDYPTDSERVLYTGTTYEDLLQTFLKEWSEKVERGQVSSLGPVERAILSIFAGWLDEHISEDLQ